MFTTTAGIVLIIFVILLILANIEAVVRAVLDFLCGVAFIVAAVSVFYWVSFVLLAP